MVLYTVLFIATFSEFTFRRLFLNNVIIMGVTSLMYYCTISGLIIINTILTYYRIKSIYKRIGTQYTAFKSTSETKS